MTFSKKRLRSRSAVKLDTAQPSDFSSYQNAYHAPHPKIKRILLVEGDAFLRFMMREIIKSLEVAVDVASDEFQCFDILEKRETEYTLVLLDAHILGMSVVEAVRRIREINVGQPTTRLSVYAVTDAHNLEDVEIAERIDFDGVIKKPITPGELLALIETFCCEI